MQLSNLPSEFFLFGERGKKIRREVILVYRIRFRLPAIFLIGSYFLETFFIETDICIDDTTRWHTFFARDISG